MKAWLVGALVAFAVIAGAFSVLYAQGEPTTPSVTLYSPINPTSSTQSWEFNFNSGVYSLSAPNTVWGVGMHYTYTAVEQASNGQSYNLATNSTIAPATGSSSGNFYQQSAELVISGTQPCSGIACVGVTENVTVTISETVVTPFKAWVSPAATYVFSSVGGQSCSASSPCKAASTSGPATTSPAKPTDVAFETFLLEFLAPITALAMVIGFVVYATGPKHPAPLLVGIGGVVALILEFVIL